MNERIRELALQADLMRYPSDSINIRIEKFAELIVYDFLSELTNDDSLGEARILTIRRLAEKWGVAK